MENVTKWKKRKILLYFLLVLVTIFALSGVSLLEDEGYAYGPEMYIYIACFAVTFMMDILMIVCTSNIKKAVRQGV